jgi:hypothetical protein
LLAGCFYNTGSLKVQFNYDTHSCYSAGSSAVIQAAHPHYFASEMTQFALGISAVSMVGLACICMFACLCFPCADADERALDPIEELPMHGRLPETTESRSRSYQA